jgi:chromatin remodeling complex protein RSC6
MQTITTRATHTCRTKPTSSSTAASIMHFPASDNERSPDRYIVRLSGALAALLGRDEGAELWEDELLAG